MMPKSAHGHTDKAPTSAVRQARALRILVVENHSDTRQGIKAFLKVLGHRATFAEDKAGALSRAGGSAFDLLLSDISLPDGNGWELLQALDEQGHRPAHAIAMSGRGDHTDQLRSLEAGFEIHLVKPFRPQELEEALRRIAALPVRPEPPAKAPAVQLPAKSRLHQRLHNGLAQHLAAASLLQGALTNGLETLSTAPADPATRLKEAAAESRRISRLLDEALAETLSLLRSV